MASGPAAFSTDYLYIYRLVVVALPCLLACSSAKVQSSFSSFIAIRQSFRFGRAISSSAAAAASATLRGNWIRSLRGWDCFESICLVAERWPQRVQAVDDADSEENSGGGENDEDDDEKNVRDTIRKREKKGKREGWMMILFCRSSRLCGRRWGYCVAREGLQGQRPVRRRVGVSSE